MSSVRFVVWVGLLALLCAAVTEAKATEDEGPGRRLQRTISSVLHLGKSKKHVAGDSLKPTSSRRADGPSLTHQKSQASLHPGDTSEGDKGDTSGSGKGTIKRTSTVKNLWGTLRGGRSQRHLPTAQSAVEPTFTKLVSDRAGEIPPFLLAAWHAILEDGRKALLVEGIFRKAGNEAAVQQMQKEIDRGGMTAASDYEPYDALDIAVLLKQFMNKQKTDDGLTGLMGGFKAIFEGKDDYEPKLAEIVEKTHILADSQRAKVGRFYIKIARTVAEYHKANKMAENNMALVYPGFMQLDTSNPFIFNLYNGVRKVVYALIMELDHPEAAPDAVPYPAPI